MKLTACTQEPNVTASTPCDQLTHLIQQHWRSSPTDPDPILCFTQIHECICRRVIGGTPSPTTLDFNAAFVQYWLGAYPYMMGSSDTEMSNEWRLARALARMPVPPVAVLASMAYAHITQDLAKVLADCEIQESEYIALGTFVLDCLHHSACRYEGNFAAFFLRKYSDVADEIGDNIIFGLRAIAWKRSLDIRARKNASIYLRL